jgi:hypothetical protein
MSTNTKRVTASDLSILSNCLLLPDGLNLARRFYDWALRFRTHIFSITPSGFTAIDEAILDCALVLFLQWSTCGWDDDPFTVDHLVNVAIDHVTASDSPVFENRRLRNKLVRAVGFVSSIYASLDEEWDLKLLHNPHSPASNAPTSPFATTCVFSTIRSPPYPAARV